MKEMLIDVRLARSNKCGKNRMARQIIPLILLAVTGVWQAAGSSASAQRSGTPQTFENCKNIEAERARLDCFKSLIPKDVSGATQGGNDASNALWSLVRTPHPHGGPDAIAIMRTADTSRSDPDFAGLMIRCREKPGLEVLLAMVRPFPPRSKRDVVVTSGTTQTTLPTEITDSGTAIVLPIDASVFSTGPWRGLKELAVKVKDPDGNIRGVIALEGIAPAIAKLSANCPSGITKP